MLLSYPLFISGLSTNPGGFYYDEACQAHNGYLIATTGTALNGTSFPLFIQCYSGDFTQWMSPLYVYLLAGLYLFIPPSALSAHILAATLVYLAIILLGVLAAQISGRNFIGLVVALTAMTTPWLFEVSRMAHEPTPLALGVALFFFCLYNAHRNERWNISDSILVAIALAIITYSYAAGRIIGVAFAFGLLIFATNKKVLYGVFRTWAIYLVLLIPFTVAYITNRDAITARFREVGYFTPEASWAELLEKFVSAFLADISPTFLLFNGDLILRHHISGTGAIFVVTFILAIAGMIIVILRKRGDAWWRFILYALVISVLPGAVTVHRQHFLRLLAFPIVLLVLTIPALSQLVGIEDAIDPEGANGKKKNISGARMLQFGVLIVLLSATAAQAFYFHAQFRKVGAERIVEYHKAYPDIFAKAIAQSSRPIYLVDGRYGPAYILALWYGTLSGLDLTIFEHLPANEPPPLDSLVLASDQTCTNCEVVAQESVYLLYRTSASKDDPSHAQIVGSQGQKDGQFSRPRGIAVDAIGNFYVADTGNHRVQKFDPNGEFVSVFGKFGTGSGDLNLPNGIAIDKSGNIYVTNAGNNKLVRFGPDGDFQKEWGQPEIEFYGPRDIEIADDGAIYIVDQGRSRVVKFDPATEIFDSFGERGVGEGQFNEPSGIALSNELVFVTDAGNKRIQVLDLEGNFVRQWPVEGWEGGIDSYPDCVFDVRTNRLYVTSEKTRDVLAFSPDGNKLEDEDLNGNIKLNKPASIDVFETNNSRTLFVLDITDSKLALIPLTAAKQKK